METVLVCLEWLKQYGLFLLLICVLIIFSRSLYRRRNNIAAIRQMNAREKAKKLNELAESFGYGYDGQKDLFYTRVDAWQRSFGYRRSYDEAALGTCMIIHCLPVYFDYQGKTWLMEFWKGEYGITAGCEVGLYHADTVLLPGQYGRAQFEAAEDEEMMDMSVMLLGRTGELFSYRMRHWWLACFAVGRHVLPEDLRTLYRLRFPTVEMKHAFVQGLLDTGFPAKNMHSASHATLLLYHDRENVLPFTGLRKWQKKWTHIYNGMLCFLYKWYTEPFEIQGDRILFLYKQLPSCLRHGLKRMGRRHGRSKTVDRGNMAEERYEDRREHHGL